MEKRIAAVVVTYNRLEELKKNIEMLKKQTMKFDKIFIIDNHSTDGTKEYFMKIQQDNIEHIFLDENIGGAGGFSHGVKVSHEQGFDYIILMDDDGRPHDIDTIKNLVEMAKMQNNPLLMLNPIVSNDGQNLSFALVGLSRVDDVKRLAVNGIFESGINPFNGTLLSKELVDKIGYPNASLFIKGDESEYTKRARKAGAYIVTVTNSMYYHPSLSKEYKKVLGFFNVLNNLEAPWKEYYRVRNYRIIDGRKTIVLLLKRTIKSILIHDSDWINRIKMVIHGYVDGSKNRTGKIVNPGQIKYKQ